VSFEGQGGADTINTGDLSAGTLTLAAALGAGDDTVDFEDTGALGAATIVIDGGAGTDTLVLDGTTAAVVDFTITNVERILIEDEDTATDGDVASAEFTFGQLDGTSFEFEAEEFDDITLIVSSDDNGETSTDLSGLTITNIDTIEINGSATVGQTIVGTEGNDVITAGAASAANEVNTITGGAGDDEFVFADSDSLEGMVSSITDYTSNEDQLTMLNAGTFAVAADTTVSDIADDDNSNATVAAIFADANSAVDIDVTDGILTLVGTTADKALANTLAEWIDIAEFVVNDDSDEVLEYIAFEFDGDTYVLESNSSDVTTSIVELTGVTGITAVSDTAAADTILIG